VRARYERAIDAAVAEKTALQASAAAWLREEIKAGRLPKQPSHQDLLRVAHIVRTTTLDGANGASKKKEANGR